MGAMGQYTIQDVARLTGITVRSLRNYLRLYEDHLNPERGACNSLLFGEEDLEAFVRIRTYLREGRDRAEIQDLLAGDQPEVGIVIRRQGENGDASGAGGETVLGSSAVAVPSVAAGGGAVATTVAPHAIVDLSGVQSCLELQNRLLEELVAENRKLRERVEVLEVRLELRREQERPMLPAPPRTRPARSGSLRLPVPWFVLRLKDGARAMMTAVYSTLFAARTVPRSRSLEHRFERRPRGPRTPVTG